MTSIVLAAAQPVREPSRDDKGGWTAGFAVAVAEHEPVFTGHYPDFPIFPGVCVMECVRRAAESAPPPEAGALRLAEVESTRFLAAVHPGDDLSIDITWTRRGEAWRCAAKVATARGQAATVRLGYRQEAPAC